MTDKTNKKLLRLLTVADLLKDAALSDLARAAHECAVTRRHLQALEAKPPQSCDLPLAVIQNAALLHERWSEPRRRRLLEELALQTAKRLECEADARRALGRAEVIHKLCHGDLKRG